MKTRIVLVIGVAALIWGTRGSAQSGAPLALASYTFEGTAVDVVGTNPPMTLSNAPLVNGTLSLSGVYGPGNPDGYLALATVNGLTYGSFSFRLEFNPVSLSEPFINIISAGPSTRWLGVSVEYGELSLRLALKDFNWLFPCPDAVLATNRWHQLVVSVDAAGGRVLVWLNGVRVREVRLAAGFQFNVEDTPAAATERIFNFNNYGNATSFHGAVDNFKVYNRNISEAEMRSLFLPVLSATRTGGQVRLAWPGDLTGYQLQSSDGNWRSNQWMPVAGNPTVTNNLQVYFVIAPKPREFFRLVR